MTADPVTPDPFWAANGIVKVVGVCAIASDAKAMANAPAITADRTCLMNWSPPAPAAAGKPWSPLGAIVPGTCMPVERLCEMGMVPSARGVAMANDAKTKRGAPGER